MCQIVLSQVSFGREAVLVGSWLSQVLILYQRDRFAFVTLVLFLS